MAEFWEQQMMDRILAFGFKFRHTKEQVMPAPEVKDIIDYVKYMRKDAVEYYIEDQRKIKENG